LKFNHAWSLCLFYVINENIVQFWIYVCWTTWFWLFLARWSDIWKPWKVKALCIDRYLWGRFRKCNKGILKKNLIMFDGYVKQHDFDCFLPSRWQYSMSLDIIHECR
jgi:hypothetical protein